MVSDFYPIPEVGVKYKTPQGELYLVKDFLYNLGNIPDTVIYVNTKDPSVEFQDGFEEWNAKQFKAVSSSEPIDDSQKDGSKGKGSSTSNTNDDDVETGTSDTKNESDEIDEENNPHKSQAPESLYSSDPKINELVDLLESSPSRFNQNYFPTDKNLSENSMVEKDVEEAFQKTIDEITKLREEGKAKRSGFLNEFLWTCGGLDKALLRMCPIDWAKKTGMGGIILGTAVLASFSGGYAAFTVFETWTAAIITGIIWGLIIFNLDRYLVNSMYSDGLASISWPEIRSGLPRIIIAIFIGVVIATPIELKIFEGKINEFIDSENKEYIKANNSRDLEKFNAEATRLKKDYENAHKELKILQKCILHEEQGLLYDRSTGDVIKDRAGIPLKNPRGHGNGEEYKALKANENPLKAKVDSLKKIYDLHMQREKNEIAQSRSNSETQLKQHFGLSKRLEVLHKISSDGFLFWVRIIISLFLITLEVVPVFSKMMQKDGLYDKLVDLESDTMDKLTRVKEFNNINVLRSGHLSIYRTQILGHSIIDEDNEGNNAFFKQDRRKENKEETDKDNQELYRKARQEAKNYIMAKIEEIFSGVPKRKEPTSNSPQGTSGEPKVKTEDPSNEAVTIGGNG